VPEYSDFAVIILGLGAVFVGLLILIGVVSLISSILRRKQPAALPTSQSDTIVMLNGAQRQMMVAAIAASIATYIGTGIEGLRIHSIKKI
jgi:sodium pump decarboxylase gamma subunit